MFVKKKKKSGQLFARVQKNYLTDTMASLYNCIPRKRNVKKEEGRYLLVQLQLNHA